MIEVSAGNVVLERLKPESITSGGIVIPDSAQHQQEQAKVVYTNNGKDFGNGVKIPSFVSVGDTVLIKKNTGVETKLDNRDLVIIKEDDILAIVEQ